MKIAIIGAGGVGGYFGARWAKAGADVTFIARGAHLAAMRNDGLKVLSANGDVTIAPVQATEDANSLRNVDLVVIAVKLWSTAEAIDTARKLVNENTAIVSLQNGVSAVDQLTQAFGAQRTLGGVAAIAALIESPGVIRHNGTMAAVSFGELDNKRTPRIEALARLCERAQVDCKIPDNIHKAIWEKFVFLASFAAMTTLTRLPLGYWRTDAETRQLFRQLAEEVIAVARAKQIPLAPDTIETMMGRIDALPPTMVASMLGDLQRGNRLELPWLSSTVAQLGRELNVDTPAHRFVHLALKLYANGKPEPLQ